MLSPPLGEGNLCQKRRHKIEMQRVCDGFGQGMTSPWVPQQAPDNAEVAVVSQSTWIAFERLNSVVSRKKEIEALRRPVVHFNSFHRGLCLGVLAKSG